MSLDCRITTAIAASLISLSVGCSSSSSSSDTPNDQSSAPPSEIDLPASSPTSEDDDSGPISTPNEEESGAGADSQSNPLGVLGGLERFTPDNAPAVIAAVSHAVRVSDVLDDIDALWGIEQAVVAGDLALESAGLVVDEPFNRAFICEGGQGRYLSTTSENTGWNGQYRFEACLLDGSFYNGEYSVTTERVVSNGADRQSVRFTATALGTTSLGVDATVHWGTIEQIVEVGIDGTVRETNVENLRYGTVVFRPGALEPTLIALAGITPEDVEFSTELTLPSAAFTQLQREDGSGSQSVVVGQSASLSYSLVDAPIPDVVMRLAAQVEEQTLRADAPDAPYTTGTFEFDVAGPLGNRLRMLTDNGDPDTVDVLIGGAGESVLSLTLPWSEIGESAHSQPRTLNVVTTSNSDTASTLH